MIRCRTLKGQTSTLAVVFLFMIVVMISLYMFMFNAISDNNVEHTAETELSYQADQIRLQASITSLMADKMWRADSIDYEDYGDQQAYVVISRFLSSDSGDKLWFDGEYVDYSVAESDIEDYITDKMEATYGNTKYRVELSNGTHTLLAVGDDSGVPATVSFPIATKSGGEGQVTIKTEGNVNVYVR